MSSQRAGNSAAETPRHAPIEMVSSLFSQLTAGKKRLKLISSCFPSRRNMNANHKAYRQINRQCLLVPQYFCLCKKSCLLHCFGNHAARSINGYFQHVLSPLLGHGNFFWMALRISQFWAEKSINRELPHIPEQLPTLLNPPELNQKAQYSFKPNSVPLHRQHISSFPDYPCVQFKQFQSSSRAKMSSEGALILPLLLMHLDLLARTLLLATNWLLLQGRSAHRSGSVGHPHWRHLPWLLDKAQGLFQRYSNPGCNQDLTPRKLVVRSQLLVTCISRQLSQEDKRFNFSSSKNASSFTLFSVIDLTQYNLDAVSHIAHSAKI